VTFLILPTVEQAADLVYPALTIIALDPTLLVNFIIFLLLKLLFRDRHVQQFDRCCTVKLIVALVTPVVLVVATDVEMAVPPDSLTLAVHTIAKEHRWLKQ
jgi:hypothetical protein